MKSVRFVGSNPRIPKQKELDAIARKKISRVKKWSNKVLKGGG